MRISRSAPPFFTRAIRSISSLKTPKPCLIEITGYLKAARANLTAGNALIGPLLPAATSTSSAFSLPAKAGATYCKRKISAATERFGDAPHVWEAQ